MKNLFINVHVKVNVHLVDKEMEKEVDLVLIQRGKSEGSTNIFPLIAEEVPTSSVFQSILDTARVMLKMTL